MHIAAIHNLPDNKAELAGALAASLGTTLYEARARLSVPGSGPLVAAVSGERGPIDKIAEGLRSVGFDVIVLYGDETGAEEGVFIVKKFRLDDRELVVESADGRVLSVSYPDIDLMLRGTCIAVKTGTVSVKERKFDLGRAVLSSGLVTTKSANIKRQVSTEEREGFINLYCGDRLAVVFIEGGLIYDSLGPALGLSRMANFTYLSAELRRRLPGAVFDDRLLRRAEQALMLGPLMSPEEDLDVAAALLARSLRRKK